MIVLDLNTFYYKRKEMKMKKKSIHIFGLIVVLIILFNTIKNMLNGPSPLDYIKLVLIAVYIILLFIYYRKK